jgi:hypothetical protein
MESSLFIYVMGIGTGIVFHYVYMARKFLKEMELEEKIDERIKRWRK